MELPEPSPSSERYQSTPEQARRQAAIRRFNLLYVILPISAVSLIVLSTLVILAINVLGVETGEYVVTLSAIADSVVILIMLGAMIIIGLFLIIVVAALVQGKRAGIAPIRRIQLLFWRLEMLTIRIGKRVNNAVPKLADPIIKIRARTAFWNVFVHRLKMLFMRG
jgi:hypothetical protein